MFLDAVGAGPPAALAAGMRTRLARTPAEVPVGAQLMTVISGTDEAGKAFSDSLKLLELTP